MLLDGVRLVEDRVDRTADALAIVQINAPLAVNIQRENPVAVLLLELHVAKRKAHRLHRFTQKRFHQLRRLQFAPPFAPGPAQRATHQNERVGFPTLSTCSHTNKR